MRGIAALVTGVAIALSPALNEKTLTVRLVCVDGVDCAQASESLNQAEEWIEGHVDASITVRAISFLKTGNMPNEYLHVAIYRFARGLFKGKEDITYYVVPHKKDAWLAGMASCIGCIGKEPAVAWSRQTGNGDFDAAVVAHEILHLMGARHVETNTIMHPTGETGIGEVGIDIVNRVQVDAVLSQLHE